ncbi:hypothetical protein [Streptomyces luteireticuli]|uniref:hypothetical protein n=1 Tax=Streptomyces luteireticuli TaxID=173858 RepID=UPI0031DE3A5A
MEIRTRQIELAEIFADIEQLKNNVHIVLDNLGFQNVVSNDEVAGDLADIRLSVVHLPISDRTFYQQVIAAGDSHDGTVNTVNAVLNQIASL